MIQFWLFLHLLGFTMWLGGGLAVMVAGIGPPGLTGLKVTRSATMASPLADIGTSLPPRGFAAVAVAATWP